MADWLVFFAGVLILAACFVLSFVVQANFDSVEKVAVLTSSFWRGVFKVPTVSEPDVISNVTALVERSV